MIPIGVHLRRMITLHWATGGVGARLIDSETRDISTWRERGEY